MFRRLNSWPNPDAVSARVGRCRVSGYNPLRRGHSSAGRASGWQPEGHGFESRWLHCRRPLATATLVSG